MSRDCEFTAELFQRCVFEDYRMTRADLDAALDEIAMAGLPPRIYAITVSVLNDEFARARRLVLA